MISEDTIKSVLERNKVPKKARKPKRRERSFYDYETLILFSKIQLDRKHLVDKESLLKEIHVLIHVHFDSAGMVKGAESKRGTKIRKDNDMEFRGGTERKLNEWKERLAIPCRARHLMGGETYTERTMNINDSRRRV